MISLDQEVRLSPKNINILTKSFNSLLVWSMSKPKMIRVKIFGHYVVQRVIKLSLELRVI